MVHLQCHVNYLHETLWEFPCQLQLDFTGPASHTEWAQVLNYQQKDCLSAVWQFCVVWCVYKSCMCIKASYRCERKGQPESLQQSGCWSFHCLTHLHVWTLVEITHWRCPIMALISISKKQTKGNHCNHYSSYPSLLPLSGLKKLKPQEVWLYTQLPFNLKLNKWHSYYC